MILETAEGVEDLFDREGVMKFINDAGLLSYNVRAIRISNYLNSLFKMAHLLTTVSYTHLDVYKRQVII